MIMLYHKTCQNKSRKDDSMKKLTATLLALLLLTGCSANTVPEATFSETIDLDVAMTEAVTSATSAATPSSAAAAVEAAFWVPYQSRFATETLITLSDEDILVEGGTEDAVTLTHDILYYEDRDTYESGNPYGEGEASERHSAEEAAAHTVVNITKPGTYRVTGKLSAGQIRIDLGEDAYEDENAVVELILDNAEISCSVAPAILFLNTYECDGSWSAETAQAAVDTSRAGANLILEGTNTVSGSHVAKIFKDQEEEKKLWKQDGAIYSYMSMNVFGPGALELTADNEGLDTELHLTINGGDILIQSGNDGINTNEDGVSVTTINNGNLTIVAGLGKEGDGIDSNGYLVINGGTVTAAANPRGDAGLDSDLGSYINGGTVIAMGSSMDWAESDSQQVTMNLQFAQQQKAGSKITVTQEDGTEIFSYQNDNENARGYSGLILSGPAFQQGETYHVYIDDVQMAYTGTDVGRGGRGGKKPGKRPEGMEFPEGTPPEMPEGMEPPEGFDPDKMDRGPRPENRKDRVPPEGFEGQMPEGDFRDMGRENANQDEASTAFYMNDKVNAFSGITAAQ